MISQLLCFIRKVVGINPNTVSSYKSRSKSKSIPFCIHSIYNFIGINIHFIKYHCKFIHKSNINISLRIFYYFYSFRCSNIRYRICSNFNNNIVNSFNNFKGFFITTRYNFFNCLQSMNFIPRVNPFRRIPNFKVHSAF